MDPLYHVSPGTRRASILTHGIDRRLGRPRREWELLAEIPAGTYLWCSYDDALRHAAETETGDIWQVDPAGLELHPDPFFETPYGKVCLEDDPEQFAGWGDAVYTTQPIPPSQITLVRGFEVIWNEKIAETNRRLAAL